MPIKKPKPLLDNSKPKLNNIKSVYKRLKETSKPISTGFRLSRYKLYTKVAKEFPKSSEFYAETLRKLNKMENGEYVGLKVNKTKYAGARFFIWLPEVFYVGPFTLYYRFKMTERIINDLEGRGITQRQIIENNRVSMSIFKFGIFKATKPKSQVYKNYLDKLEGIIKSNK